MHFRSFLAPVLAVLLLVVWTAVVSADRGDEVKRLQRATEVFSEIMKTPDKGIPADLLDKCECVGIVPGLKKGGLGLGGKYGKGLVMCRKSDRSWTAPSFITIEGGSVGFQIGFTQIDVVMLMMNRKGVEKLIGDKFTIGADASAAAGPVGRQTAAQTNIRMDAEILTYSRAKGLFAGVSLSGSTLRADDGANKAVYGKELTAKEIVREGKVRPPAAAHRLLAILTKASPKHVESK